MQKTREKILAYLENTNTASALELSQLFEMTAANVRHHLNVLVEQDFIEIVGEDASNGKGRPTLRYMAMKGKETNGLLLLVEVMIEEVRGMRTARQQEKRLGEIGNLLAKTEEQPKGSITIRLGNAMNQMNELGYKAHWEAHADGPRAILGRCPFAGIVDKYPELCQMDEIMLETMLGEEVELQDRFARKPEGPHGCMFGIN